MSAEGHDHGHDHEHEHHHKDTFITKYIFSIDHKMIAKQYLITGIVMGIIGVGMSLLFRMQLAWPEESFKIFNILLGDKFAPEGVMANDIYLALVTIHGTIMVFFVLTAGLSGTFSNLLIPLQIGARDMASGFMNMISYWLFFLSSVIMICSLFVEAGPASSGWTIYPPLSALPQAIPGSGTGMTLWLVSMAIFIASSLMGSLNYVVTVINLRTKGMSMTRLPLTIWAFFVTAIIGIISFPVLLSAALLLIFDRSFGTSFFLSDIYIAGEVLHYQGGSPVLFEHLFWFLGHPEVYIVLLPALGITSEIIATNSRKPIFGYRAMIMSILAIAFLSTIVWGHHMFISALYGMFAGVYHWFPRMFGRMLNKNLGYVHFWVTAVCAYGVFFPMHFIGLAGLPRRYYTNTNFPLFDDLQNVNVLITTFALIGGAFQLVFLYNFFVSIFYGKKAEQNPWKSNTLEWTAPVEHIHGNWPGEIPEVHRWPYDYSKPGHDVDFVPQNVPMKEGEEVLHH